MLHLVKHALALLLEGKLFRDMRYFYRRLAIGVGLTVAVMMIASLVIKSLIALALIGGFIGGALQPYLFEDVRYR